MAFAEVRRHYYLMFAWKPSSWNNMLVPEVLLATISKSTKPNTKPSQVPSKVTNWPVDMMANTFYFTLANNTIENLIHKNAYHPSIGISDSQFGAGVVSCVTMCRKIFHFYAFDCVCASMRVCNVQQTSHINMNDDQYGRWNTLWWWSKNRMKLLRKSQATKSTMTMKDRQGDDGVVLICDVADCCCCWKVLHAIFLVFVFFFLPLKTTPNAE